MTLAPVPSPAIAARLRSWAPEAGLAAVVLGIGVLELSTLSWRYLILVLAFALATLLCRQAPAVGLALVWVACSWQVLASLDVLLVQASAAAVSFGAARWGRLGTVVASGLSLPLGMACGVLLSDYFALDHVLRFVGSRLLLDLSYQVGFPYVLVIGFVGTVCLIVPWLLGLVLRATSLAETSRVSQMAAEEDATAAQRETQQVREIARLREDQARLANDVHDVVGHSLAVILAQAEAGQYLEDPERLKATLATIAGSARGSLRDVRAVLTAARDEAARGGLDDLVAGVRAGGHEVLSSEVGTPQPLPPELEIVAYRVLQEMLTNAIRHGARDEPVFLERHWPDGSWEGELRMEVRNVIDGGGEGREGSGQGLAGMRRRLESVGGRLDVRRRDEAAGPTFTTTAWVPVRSTAVRAGVR